MRRPMEAFRVVARDPSTGEKSEERSRYLVTGEEKTLVGRAAEFEQVDVDPAVYLENKDGRSTSFASWILEHQWKADGRLYR